ncbi:hypothetical protein KSD_93310 [Ktedonobacter sp. SOSP1-85]|nr:hypothetical protein KSD_93310 [Ktedonobacter sp. SOSP1-85]
MAKSGQIRACVHKPLPQRHGVSDRNLLTCFSNAHLEDLQNQTIIFDNHSITLCSRASILPPDREHASLLLQA